MQAIASVPFAVLLMGCALVNADRQKRQSFRDQQALDQLKEAFKTLPDAIVPFVQKLIEVGPMFGPVLFPRDPRSISPGSGPGNQIQATLFSDWKSTPEYQQLAFGCKTIPDVLIPVITNFYTIVMRAVPVVSSAIETERMKQGLPP